MTPLPPARRFLRPAIVLVCAGLACSRGAQVETGPGPAPGTSTRPDGRSVLKSMHKRWSGKWFMTLSFKQNTVFIAQTGRETKQVWNEYLSIPGKLRIDYLPLNTRSGVLYADGQMYAFTSGKQQAVQPGWNPLLLLLGDVNVQSPDTTAAQLDSMGFNLSIARKDTWGGKSVWVVGAPAGDSTSTQFWVDEDSLLIRRVVQRDTRGQKPVVTDTRFQKYTIFAGAPVAIQMRFYRDGRLYFKEDYFNVQVNETLPVELFEPASWGRSQLKR